MVENVEYNINMKALHRISEPLRKLDAMVGMDSLKERVVDQIIYFMQDLHLPPLPQQSAQIKGNKTEKAYELGKMLAQKAIEKKITTAVFDRGANRYHGRVKAIAEGAREGGLKI